MGIPAASARADKEEPSHVVAQSGFERDSDGDGVADGWLRWTRNERGGPDPSVSYWIETGDPAVGSSSQGCKVVHPEAGITIPFRPVIRNGLFRSSIRIKVLSGEAIVQGQGQHGGFGWNVMTPENAGEWTEIRREFRPNRWLAGHAGVIAFSRVNGTEFLLDDLSVEFIGEGSHDPSPAPRSTPVGADKKIVNACGSSPTIAWVRDHVDQLELAPFNGTTLKLTYEFANQFWSRNKVEARLVDQAIADLKATRFRKFTDNFLWCNTVPGGSVGSLDYHGDWYDDGWWDAIRHNARMVARICKQGGLKGIFFDTEHYHGRCFDYQKQPQKDEKTYEQFAAQARRRGREFITAINQEHPKIAILFLMASSFTADDMWHDPSLRLEQTEFGLMPPFVDGMIESSTPQTRFIDGFERAYNFTEYAQFVQARNVITKEASALSEFPERYRNRIETAFGVAVAWHSPRQAEDALHYGLHVADEYVWLWSHSRNYNWQEGWADRERIAAVVNARLPRDTAERTSADDLPDRWQVRNPAFHAAAMISKGYEELEFERVGYVEADEDPRSGSGDFTHGAVSIALDYNLRSIVLDMGRMSDVDAIHLYSGLARLGNARLDDTNVSLLTSEDNDAYEPVAFTYQESDRFTIELSSIDSDARYFKIHAAIPGKTGTHFSTGTYFKSPKVFRKP